MHLVCCIFLALVLAGSVAGILCLGLSVFATCIMVTSHLAIH